jgi:hypothetical protein
MIANEMENILVFDCKYAERVEREHNRWLLYKTPVSGLHLQTKGNHGIHERAGELLPMYTGKIV